MKKYLVIFCFLLVSGRVSSQSSNVTLASKWLHNYQFNNVEIDGNFAYCSSDAILSVVDVSNPASTKGLGQIVLPDKISWIHFDNSKLYVASDDSGLCIVDVSNPHIPVLMGHCPFTGKALSVTVSGNYAFVAADASGMKVIDISNPNAPVEVSSYSTGSSHAKVIDLYLNHVCIANADSLLLVDISNPLLPVLTGSYSVQAYNVVVSGNHAFVLSPNKVNIINITNPAIPVLDGTITSQFSSFDNSLAVSGNFVYITGGMYGFGVWDVSNISSPAPVGGYLNGMGIISNSNQELNVSGTTIYFLQYESTSFSSMDIVNVTVPSSPVKIGNYIQPQIRTGLCTSGNYLYSGGWTPPGNEMITIFDISDPAHPFHTGMFTDTSLNAFGSAYSITVSGNYLYISGTRISPGNFFGMKIIDISNPANPVLTGTFSISNQMANGMALSGNFAYVCYSALGLVVIDVSNPAQPVQAGSVLLSGGFSAGCIAISGSYAYVTDNSANLHMIDISNPNIPAEVGTFQLVAAASDIDVDGNYAYVAVGEDGFQVVDISTPAIPVLTGAYTAVSSDDRLSIDKEGNYVYLSDFMNGMQVIDVTNPASPVQAGYYYDILYYATNIFADSQHSYLAADEGVYIFNGGVTGINETETNKNSVVSVFPNPASGNFILTSSDVIKKGTVEVYSLEGKKIFSQAVSTFSKMEMHLDAAPGIYFLKVVDENKQFITKLIISE